MTTRLNATVLAAVLLGSSVQDAAGPRAILIEARDLAYDANYRNDQAGLRAAIAALQPLAEFQEERAYVYYYLSWTFWVLAGSQAQEKNLPAAQESAALAVEHARAGLAARERDPEFHTALANALIATAVLGRTQFAAILTELQAVRRKALDLGPDNPRAVLMDAGIIFNSPPEMGGSQERGLARWREALRLFDAESRARMVDPLAPRWGHAIAWGGMATLYLRTTPPRKDEARRAAETALGMRPDFWFVREQLLPKLRE
jgi:hypothetical protein